MGDYLPGAEPFFFEGNRTGCLLVHGFTGTPYEMRGLGEWLARERGYTVLAPVLLGHATDVQDMMGTDWRDWHNAVDAAYCRLRSDCDRVFAIGLSLGGALALHLAAHRPLDGVVAAAAPAYASHPFLIWFRTFPFLHRLFPYVLKDSREDDTQDPGVAAVHPGYDRTPTQPARSMILEFLPHMRSQLPQVSAPALLLQGRQDRTIPADSMALIHAELGTPAKRMVWLEPSGHLVLEDYSKDRAFAEIDTFIVERISATAR